MVQPVGIVDEQVGFQCVGYAQKEFCVDARPLEDFVDVGACATEAIGQPCGCQPSLQEFLSDYFSDVGLFH